MAYSVLTLIDDIATILDDVAILTKVAAKKTAGVLGDDLALNAQQVTGVKAVRELPVVMAVAVGSHKNKAILVPVALLISAFAPWAVVPLLMVGGAFLCYEGFEKLAHRFLHKAGEDEHLTIPSDPDVDIVALEQEKIHGAIRTDFILSAEIIAITLGTVAEQSLPTQITVLSGIALIMTVGVYGLVAAIVKLDDAGLYLVERPGMLARSIGRGILAAAPWLLKTLSVAGTAAMFLVGGDIVLHGISAAHHWIEGVAHSASAVPAVGGVLHALVPPLLNALGGILTGAFALIIISGLKRVVGPVFAKS